MKDIAIEGDLSYFSMKEILYLFSRFKKSGRLIIKGEGNIYISDGKVLHAEMDNKEGIEAFFSLGLKKEGKFVFQPDEKPSVNTIFQPLSDLIDQIETREAQIEEFKKDLPPLSIIPEKSSKVPEGDKIALKKDEWKVLILVDGKRKLSEIIKMSPLSELDTLKALSWLFKESLLYDPEERKRVLEEGIKKTNLFLKTFGEGPWVGAVRELIKQYGIEDCVSLDVKSMQVNEKKFSLDLEKTKKFFSDVLTSLEKKATETLGKLLVKKRMKEIENES
ncbi:MAG: DUF4388 domain-containing protein [candidate division WOR-3 bacterium]